MTANLGVNTNKVDAFASEMVFAPIADKQFVVLAFRVRLRRLRFGGTCWHGHQCREAHWKHFCKQEQPQMTLLDLQKGRNLAKKDDLLEL